MIQQVSVAELPIGSEPGVQAFGEVDRGPQLLLRAELGKRRGGGGPVDAQRGELGGNGAGAPT